MRYDFVLKATLFYASLTGTCIMLIPSHSGQISFLHWKRVTGNKTLGRRDQHPACNPLNIYRAFEYCSKVFSQALFHLICDQNSNWEKKTLCVCVWVHGHICTCAHICVTCPLAFFLWYFSDSFLGPVLSFNSHCAYLTKFRTRPSFSGDIRNGSRVHCTKTRWAPSRKIKNYW